MRRPSGDLFRRILMGGFLLSVVGGYRCTVAQTQLDLSSQSRKVDFSKAPTTRPFKTGTTLPTTCQVGEMFFKTTAVSGNNLYACTSINTWMQTGSSSSSSVSLSEQLADLQLATTSSTTLSIGNLCTSTTPCNVAVGGARYQITNSAFVALSGAINTADSLFVYLNPSGVITVEYPSGATGLTVLCTRCTAIGVTQPSFPANVLALGVASYGPSNTTGVTWTSVTDFRVFLAAPDLTTLRPATAGGVNVVCVSSACETSLDSSYAAIQSGTNDFSGNNQFGAGVGGFDNAIRNDVSTGTTNNLLVKLQNGSAVTATTADQHGVIGVALSGGGTSGYARVRFKGYALCSFDNTTVVDDYVQISSTSAGQCHDAGSQRPLSGEILGRVLTAGSGAQTVWLALDENASGTAIIDVQTNFQLTGGAAWAPLAQSTIPALSTTGCFTWQFWATNITNSSGASFRIIFGSTIIATGSVTTSSMHGMICNRGARTSQHASTSIGSGTWTGSANQSLDLTIDTTVPTSFRIEIQSTGGDSVRLDNYLILLIR